MSDARNAGRLRIAVVLAVGHAIVFIYAYPGFMAWDSVEQLAQARSGHLTDWHPPIMSALWGVLDRIVAGGLLLLILQCATFLAGLYVLLRRRMSGTRAAILAVAIFAFPPVLAQMAVLVKDSLMAGALLAGCAGLTSERRGARIAGLAFFFLAAALRHNAISLVVPLVALLSPWPASRGTWTRIAAGAGIALALTIAAFGINRALTDEKTHPFHQSVAPMDIVGTLAWADDLSDAEVRALLPGVQFAPASGIQAHARRIYNVEIWWGLLIRGDDRMFDDPTTPVLRDGVTSGWWNLVTAHPRAYLTSRADIFRMMLGLTTGRVTPVYEARNEASMLKNTFQPYTPRPWIQRWLSKWMLWWGGRSIIFRPYLYVAFALGLLVVMRRDRLALALLGSSFACLAMLLIVAPAPDGRYVFWSIVTALVAAAIRVFGRRSDLGAAVGPRDAQARTIDDA